MTELRKKLENVRGKNTGRDGQEDIKRGELSVARGGQPV